MVSKRHEAIAFYLLVTSILALVIVSLSFKYYFPDETLLLEQDLDIYTFETVTYNASVFDVEEHIFKISMSNMTSITMPAMAANVKVIINSNFTATLSGPHDYVVYNGEIEEVVLTDVGLAVSFHAAFSTLRNRNPIYISLTTVTCVLALYYFYITTKMKREEKAKVEENTQEIAK